MQRVKLRNIAKYSDTRTNLSEITKQNYIGTDNLLQNKMGKVDSDYFINSGTITEYIKADILVANIRPYLRKIWFANNYGGSSADVLTIRTDNPDFDSKFVYYSLFQDIFFEWAMMGAKGSKMPRGDKRQIMEFEIPKYPLPTQQKIASILSALDDKIELNRKVNSELEKLARTIYDYWFLQFDFPNANGAPYRTSGGVMTYSKVLKREIPDGWEIKTLYDVATYTNGLASQKFRPRGDEKYRVIKIREMHEGFSKDTEFVDISVPKSVIVRDGDILFSWSASLEVMLWSGGIGSLNQHIFKVTSDELPKSYLYSQLLNYLQVFQKIAENRKTTMGHITLDHLKQAKVFVPSEKILDKFDKQVKPIFEKIQKNNQESRELAELRDWLLPMLMNGQISV